MDKQTELEHEHECMFIRTMYITDIIAQCHAFIKTERKFLLILDIDDTILSTLPNKVLVDEQLRDLFALVYTHRKPTDILFCTARSCASKAITLTQLYNAELIKNSQYMPYYKVLYSPNVDNKPTKSNTIFNYLKGNNIDTDTHIIMVDDDFNQVFSIYKQLISMNYKFTTWHYVASWAQMNNEWIPQQL